MSSNFFLGLFMGVSILSLIEIVYYVTLRLACNLNYRRNKKIKARRISGIDVDHVPGIKVDYTPNVETVKQD